MWNWVGLIVGGLIVAGLGAWLLLVVSLRAKYPPVLNAVRRMNRRFTNPRVMKTAGIPGASASVIHHVGRSSGRPYTTPIGAVERESGFVIALPYGTSPDWVKNLSAAGAAVIGTEGRTYRVGSAHVVGAADVDRYFSPRSRLAHRLYGVDQFLVLDHVGADVATGDHR